MKKAYVSKPYGFGDIYCKANTMSYKEIFILPTIVVDKPVHKYEKTALSRPPQKIFIFRSSFTIYESIINT